MPSLKDLRNRIASVKATQKITKAMQMVAAAKLRRAQSAAEAARPYAERMAQVLGNLASGIIDRSGDAAPPRRHRLRPDASSRSSAPPSAAFAARSTPRSRALRATTPTASSAEGKTVKIICVGKKGYRHPAPPVRRADHRLRRPARGAPARLRARRHGRAEGPEPVRAGRVRRRDAVLLALPLGDRPDPDGAADHPGPDRHRHARGESMRSTTTSPTKARSLTTLLAAQRLRPDLPGAPRERRIRAGRAHERHGQRDPQCRRDDQEADDDLQPVASGDDHQGTHRNHFGRRGALIR